MADLGFKGEKVFVYGLGRSGQAMAAALYADGAEVYIYDKTPLDELLQSIGIKNLLNKPKVYFVDGGSADFQSFKGFFKSPGISMKDAVVQQAQSAGLDIMGDVDLLYRREPNAQFVAITGTNGKSTTTALIGHVLEKAGKKVATGGNLGTAVLNLPVGQDYYVLELSSYQLETMHEMKIDYAVLLNITPDHLVRHGDMSNYLEVKKKVFSNEDGFHVLGIDNPELLALSTAGDFHTVSTEGATAELQVNPEGVLVEGENEVMDMKEFSHLPGRHNWQNIACAYAILKEIVSAELICKFVFTFKSLPHRLEKVAEYNGVKFYNDSKATNPDSAIRALRSFKHIFWICGGEMKDEGMYPCLRHLSDVECAFVIGTQTPVIASQLQGYVETVECGTLEEAVYKSWRKYKVSGLDDAVFLFSPACASWDQFDSFEHRGDAFVNLCHELVNRLQVEQQ